MVAPVGGCTDTSTSSPFFSLNCSTTSRGSVTAREDPVCTILRVMSVFYQYFCGRWPSVTGLVFSHRWPRGRKPVCDPASDHVGPCRQTSRGHQVPLRIREQLVAAKRAILHRQLPESGWVSVPIRAEADVPDI